VTRPGSSECASALSGDRSTLDTSTHAGSAVASSSPWTLVHPRRPESTPRDWCRAGQGTIGGRSFAQDAPPSTHPTIGPGLVNDDELRDALTALGLDVDALDPHLLQALAADDPAPITNDAPETANR
jgi:hypothetical protein